MLRADVLIAEALRFCLRGFHGVADHRTNHQPVRGRAGHLGQALELGAQTPAQRGRCQTSLDQYLRHDPVSLFYEGHQEMFGFHLGVVELTHQFLGVQ